MLYWQRRYFVIDIQPLITLLGNNIFQQNLLFALAIHCGVCVQNFIQIRSDLIFLLYDA